MVNYHKSWMCEGTMAPKGRKEDPSGGKGRIKFRYTDPERTMEFTIENVAGDGVKEALQTLGSAIAGRNLVTQRRLKNGNGATSEGVTPDEEDAVPEEEVPVEEPAEDVEEESA